MNEDRFPFCMEIEKFLSGFRNKNPDEATEGPDFVSALQKTRRTPEGNFEEVLEDE